MSRPAHATHASANGPLAGLPSCAVLDELLLRRVEHPEQAKRIDADIRKRFQKRVAVMVLDMSGFSSLVQRYGIIHYLAMIGRMRRVVAPAVERNRGMTIKFEADNCFAVFPKPNHAATAAVQILHDMALANLSTPDESDVHVCMGVGYGPVLLACDDLYGNELNLASKLGEDVSVKGEILLTEAARRRLSKKFALEELPVTVSGVTMNAFRLRP